MYRFIGVWRFWNIYRIHANNVHEDYWYLKNTSDIFVIYCEYVVEVIRKKDFYGWFMLGSRMRKKTSAPTNTEGWRMNVYPGLLRVREHKCEQN
jgi:hypothetical protein